MQFASLAVLAFVEAAIGEADKICVCVCVREGRRSIILVGMGSSLWFHLLRKVLVEMSPLSSCLRGPLGPIADFILAVVAVVCHANMFTHRMSEYATDGYCSNTTRKPDRIRHITVIRCDVYNFEHGPFAISCVQAVTDLEVFRLNNRGTEVFDGVFEWISFAYTAGIESVM